VSPKGIIRLVNAADMPSSLLEDWGPAVKPEGLPIAEKRGLWFPAHGRGIAMGMWECSPGRWRREVMLAEYAYFISGRGCFVPDGGVPFDIRPGDAIFFPMNTTGTWEITETIRKSFVMFDTSSARLLLRIFFWPIKRLALYLLRAQAPKSGK
jgi:uncharacterized cupin superfamily protein